MRKSGYKIISRLLVIVLVMLMIPVGITWAKYSLTVPAGEIEFKIQLNPTGNSYTDDSKSDNKIEAGQEKQEEAVEQEDNTKQKENVQNNEANDALEENAQNNEGNDAQEENVQNNENIEPRITFN